LKIEKKNRYPRIKQNFEKGLPKNPVADFFLYKRVGWWIGFCGNQLVPQETAMFFAWRSDANPYVFFYRNNWGPEFKHPLFHG